MARGRGPGAAHGAPAPGPHARRRRRRAGVSTQYLSEVERGRKEPSSEILGAVSGALGLRLADLAGRVARTLSTHGAAGRPQGPLALAA